MAGTKADVSAPMDKATSHGYALASLGYRLSNDGGSFPNSVKDLTAGIRFLRANAAKYHLDPNKFALSGCSAGSYYTALLAAISGGGHNFDDAALGNSGVSSAVQVAACSSALTDIELLDDHQAINTGVRYSFDHETANSPEATYIGASLVPSAVASNATTKEKLRLANPLTYVTTEHCAGIAPILMMHAQDDNLLPWQQSQILVDKMNQVCGAGKAEMDKLASGGHCKFSSEKKIFDYIDAVLKK
jgi:acetyl esterase/lipase